MLRLRREIMLHNADEQLAVVVGLWKRDLDRGVLQALLQTHEVSADSILLLDSIKAGECPPFDCDVVVFDYRTLARSFIDLVLRALGSKDRPILLGLDAVGGGAALCDYVIDAFPRLSGVGGNEQHTGFISSSAVTPPPKTVAPPPKTDKFAVGSAPDELRILVTFGGAGDKRRETRLLRALHSSAGPLLDLQIYGSLATEQECGGTTVAPGNAVKASISDKMQVRRHSFDPSLSQRLPEFDIVFTHFGLTAYEAAAAGCAVVLVNPSTYHEQLARRAGFFTLPRAPLLHMRWVRLLRKLLQNPDAVRAHSAKALSPSGRTAVDVVLELVRYRRVQISSRSSEQLRADGARCPVCSSRSASLLYRFPAKNYFRCQDCGVLFMQRLMAHGIRYNTDYFFREYKKQYGKSYLEDFHHIKDMGAARMAHIRDLLSASSGGGTGAATTVTTVTTATTVTTVTTIDAQCGTLLDIGCAYGPFMAAAQESGLASYGIDVAEDAVTYVVENLGYQAACIPVQELNAAQQFGHDSFDVVTMWYVIEHFDLLDPVLKQIATLVAPNGIFAFSTPNGSGVSARSDHERFLRNSPEDHYTIWEVKRTAGILSRYGFRVERVIVTGHHPERIPFLGRWAGWAPIGWVLKRLSRVFALGDTFEVYARRVA